MKRWLLLTFLVSSSLFAKDGTFVNPITDVCWECLFPITVAGVNTTPKYKDQVKYNTHFCICGGALLKGAPPKVGVPLSFWEPLYLVDVTRHAYKLVGLGGVSIGKESIKNRGSVGITADGPNQNSFYHVHFYRYPIFALLELFTDFIYADKGELDIGYMSELDPLWNDEQLAIIFNGEAGFFANDLAQIACMGDCLSSTANKPQDALFWCAGCEGSLYPFTGSVAHHVGGIQASSLLVQRMLAKLHRSYLLKGYDKDEFCEAKHLPIIKKSLYKTQLVYPTAQTKGQCHPLGKSDVLWGSGKSFPKKGEDFVYLIWTKKQCCLDAVKPIVGGGQ